MTETRKIALFVLILIAAAAAIFFAGCTSDGQVDYNAVMRGTRAVLDTYDRTSRTDRADEEDEQPEAIQTQYPVLYDGYGRPIYPPR